MANLTYTVVKNDEQYTEYCNILEELLSSGLDNQEAINEYELLHLLISTWDGKNSGMPELDPVELVKSFKDDHGLNQTELAEIAGVGKSYISEILNYKKKMSKKVIRNIASHFKIQQEALNKPYRLEGEGKVEENERTNESPVYDFFTGRLVNYQEETRVHESQKADLEYSEAK